MSSLHPLPLFGQATQIEVHCHRWEQVSFLCFSGVCLPLVCPLLTDYCWRFPNEYVYLLRIIPTPVLLLNDSCN